MSTLAAAAAGVSVETRSLAASQAAQRAAAKLAEDGVAAKLAAKDPGLWGAAAGRGAADRLGWLDAPGVSRGLIGEFAELAERAREDRLDHIVLAGMGGCSLAPEVITRTASVPLTVLDTTDPHQVAAALGDRLDRTLVIVSSKSGMTIETQSHRRIYELALSDLGLAPGEIARRFVVVTDPGSPLEAAARTAGYHVVLADPEVSGGFGALTAYGLTPSALAGVDVAALLDDADGILPSLGHDHHNPGLTLGAVIGGFAADGHDKAVIADCGCGIAGFGEWVEQLLAGSTGKSGRGVLPVVVESAGAPGFSPGPDIHLIALASASDSAGAAGSMLLGAGPGGASRPGEAPTAGGAQSGAAPGVIFGQVAPSPAAPAERSSGPAAAEAACVPPGAAVAHPGATGPGRVGHPVDTAIAGPLGAQFLVWQYAVAVAGRILGINPFSQPDVQESKHNTAALLARAGGGPLPVGGPAFVDGVVEVHMDPERLRGATDLAGVIDSLVWALPPEGYLAIMAYLDRTSDGDVACLRTALAARTTRPVTFGWAPRCVHSTGQFHGGGPQTGVFLQITGAIERDVLVPGKAYSLGRLQLAQALGDLAALRGRGRTAVRLHLRDRSAGLAQLLDAATAGAGMAGAAAYGLDYRAGGSSVTASAHRAMPERANGGAPGTGDHGPSGAPRPAARPAATEPAGGKGAAGTAGEPEPGDGATGEQERGGATAGGME